MKLLWTIGVITAIAIIVRGMYRWRAHRDRNILFIDNSKLRHRSMAELQTKKRY